jgi:drug/metabolite transporter (DMT)-like permease
MPTNPSRPFYPTASIVLGATLWGVIWYPMRLLEQGGLAGIWLTLAIYATALIVSLPVTYRAIPELSRSPLWLALLVVTAGWTNIAFVEAVLEGNILRVLLLFYLSPLWATLMGWLLLRERLSRLGVASLAIAMAGALFMLWNPETGTPWPESRADWLALTSGFAFALSNVATRRVQDASVATKVFCVWSGVTVMALVLLPVFGSALPEISWPVAGGAVLLGVGILLMTLLIQYGVTHLPVYRSAVITFVELVAGAISQHWLTDEVVATREWIGGALIVAGAYLAVRASLPKDKSL